jgi:sulfatase modifying factor 1
MRRAVVLAALLLAACERGSAGTDADASPDAALPWDAGEPAAPRTGMLWIPPGVLLAGTPPASLPRIPDQELSGEQVVMRGFYIDEYPYPNEIGAIPTSSVTRDEAVELCSAQGKRLCTELELERACKGPNNTTYPYGDTYRAATCATGSQRTQVPNGVNAACKSGFGVPDLVGTVFVWTASDWGRDGSKPGQVVIRGGNGLDGDVVSRCANARAQKPEVRRVEIGVRCCAGQPNTFQVLLDVVRGDPFALVPVEPGLAAAIERLVPEEIQSRATGPGRVPFHVERTWLWRPVGNEELMLGGGCALVPDKRCGVLVGRRGPGGLSALTFVATDKWQPTLGETDEARHLFVHGGDERGAFRKKLTYDWGRLAIGEKQYKSRVRGHDRFE